MQILQAHCSFAVWNNSGSTAAWTHMFSSFSAVAKVYLSIKSMALIYTCISSSAPSLAVQVEQGVISN